MQLPVGTRIVGIRFFRHISRFLECEIVRLTRARTVASPFTVSGATILAQRDKPGFFRRKSVIGPEHRELLTRPAFFCGSVVNIFVLSKCETGEEDYQASYLSLCVSIRTIRSKLSLSFSLSMSPLTRGALETSPFFSHASTDAVGNKTLL